MAVILGEARLTAFCCWVVSKTLPGLLTAFCAAMAFCISSRTLASVPARVVSTVFWLEFRVKAVSMLLWLGGAAKVVAAVKKRMRGRTLWEFTLIILSSV
jgi:hypothetical protein